jgi:hypothetical protein
MLRNLFLFLAARKLVDQPVGIGFDGRDGVVAGELVAVSPLGLTIREDDGELTSVPLGGVHRIVHGEAFARRFDRVLTRKKACEANQAETGAKPAFTPEEIAALLAGREGHA